MVSTADRPAGRAKTRGPAPGLDAANCLAVSAPTELAVRLLDRLNVTLVAFCRPPCATVYTHGRRIVRNG